MPFWKGALQLFGISTIVLFTTLAASTPASSLPIPRDQNPPCNPNELALRSEVLRLEAPASIEVSALLAGESVSCLATPEGDHAFRAALSFLRKPRFKVKHDKPVNAVALSPDGTHLGTASDDHTAQVWATTGERLSTLHYDHEIGEVMFSPDSKWMATVSWDTIGLYSIADKKEHRLSAPGFKSLALASHDVIALGTSDHAKVLDAVSGRELVSLERKGLRIVALDAEGKLLGSLSGNLIQIVNLGTKETISLPMQGPVAMIEFSPRGDLLATANGDGTARLYDTKTGRPFGHPLYAGSSVERVVFDESGRLLGLLDKTGVVRIFEVRNECKQLSRLPVQHSITSIALGSDGVVIIGSTDHSTRLFESTTGREIARLIQDGPVTKVAAANKPAPVVAIAGGQSAMLVEITRGSNVASLSEQQAVSFAAFGGGNLAVSDKADVRIFNAVDGGKLAEQPKSTFPVTDLRYSPNGQFLAISRQNKNNYIVDLFDRSITKRVSDSQDTPIPAVSFSSDSTLLAVAGYDTQWEGMNQASIRVFKTSSGIQIHRTKSRPGQPQSVAISPDNQFFALGTSLGAYVFPRAKGFSERRLASDESIRAIVFSSDGNWIALGTERGTVYVIGLKDHQNDHHIYGPYDGTVIALAFSDDNRTLASLDSSKMIHVFDVIDKTEISRFPETDTKAFVFRNKQLITLALDEEGPFLQTHILHSKELIGLACSIVGRNLSHDEWNTYVGSRGYHQLCPEKP